MEKAFEVIDHTADIGITAYGADIKQVFANAAVALFSLMVELNDIKEDVQRDLHLSAEDDEILIVEWLNELIYIFDVEHIIFKRFEIVDFASGQIKAKCFGEKIRPGQHELKREIKAATHHMLRISKDHNGYKVQVIFDI